MTSTLRTYSSKIKIAIMAILIGFTVTACTGDGPPANDTQQQSQKTVETYQHAAETAVPYPLAEMQRGGWLERRLLRENLLRQNDAHRIAYVTLLNALGAPIVQYTIQGMVFELNSQMTTEDKITYAGCGSNCGNSAVTKSPGDNGTWGPEPHAISFYTTEGVQVKFNGLYIESDSPQNLTTKPLIVYNPDTAKPSTTAGGVSSVKTGGITTK